jgi:hypothetical protein
MHIVKVRLTYHQSESLTMTKCKPNSDDQVESPRRKLSLERLGKPLKRQCVRALDVWIGFASVDLVCRLRSASHRRLNADDGIRTDRAAGMRTRPMTVTAGFLTWQPAKLA